MLRAKDIGFIRIILLAGSKELEQIWNQKMKEKKKAPPQPTYKVVYTHFVDLFIYFYIL